MKPLSRVRLLVTPWTATYQAPPSMGISRQEYWSGVPLPSPGDFECCVNRIIPCVFFCLSYFFAQHYIYLFPLLYNDGSGIDCCDHNSFIRCTFGLFRVCGNYEQHYCEHFSLCILIRTGVHFNRAHASE